MAEKFQPVLSPSSAQPFIAPAVRDTGLAEGIASLGKLGVDAYTGYQTAQQAKGYEADINAYLQSQVEADSRKDIFEMDMAGKVKTEDEMWNSAGVIPEHIGLGGDGTDEFTGAAPGGRMVEAGDIDQVQQGMSRTMEKFLQAQRQGRMTIGELEARIMDTTRRAISRNPFLQDELLRAGQKYMDISGASAYMKSQLKAEKSKADQQEEVYKQHVAWASKYGIPMTRRNWMEEAAQAAVLEGEHTRKVSYMDEAIKRRTIKQNELSDIVNDPTTRQQHMAGEMLKFKTTYTRLNGMEQFSTNDKVLAMSNEIDSSINFLESISAQLPSGSSGAISGQIALLNKQKELYKDLLEGGPNAKAAKNGLELAESLAKLPYVRDEVKLSMLQKGTSAMFNIAQASGQIPLSQDRAAELMQAVDMMIPTGASSPLAVVNLGTPDGKYQASAVFAMLDPEKAENARDVNSATISTALKHIAAVPDGNQSAQLSDVLFEQILSQSRATGKPITALLNDTALSEMNRYITGLMGNARSDGGKVDYNPNTNTFSYLDSTGNINQAGSDRANKMFKTLLLVNGFGDEATIDKWGAFFAGKGAAPSQPKPWEARTPAEAFDLFEAGTITEPEYMAIIKDMKGKSKVTTTPDRSIPEVTSKALLEPQATQESTSKSTYENIKPLNPALATPTPRFKQTLASKTPDEIAALYDAGEITGEEMKTALKKGREASPASLKDITPTKKPDTRPSVQQESMDVAIKALEKFNSKYKTSPLLKRDPKTDAIESSGVDQVLLEGLNEVHPAAGMAAGAALVALGGVQAIPSLAKYMPKLLATAGKVDAMAMKKGAVPHAGAKASMSNVRPAGANEGAHAAIVNSILNTAAKTKKAKMETLYKEYWSKGWQKDMVELPKTDAEWSSAIARANEYVAERVKPSTLDIPKKVK